MATLAPPFALAAALTVVAGPAMAQPPPMSELNGDPMMNGRTNAYRPDPNSFMNPPPMGGPPGDSGCREGKPRTGTPKVVRTMPAPGATVRPGAMVLSITFDRPMACDANLQTSHFPLPCPDGKGAVIISTDRRTLTTVCLVEAGSSYIMPIVDFVADGGVRSERYDLAFTTSTGPPVRDAAQAMALEKAGPAQP